MKRLIRRWRRLAASIKYQVQLDRIYAQRDKALLERAESELRLSV